MEKITKTLNWSEISDILNHNLNSIVVSAGGFSGVGSTEKGLFSDLTELSLAYPNPEEGWFAYVYDNSEIYLAYPEEGSWVTSTYPMTNNIISLKPYVSMGVITENVPILMMEGGTVSEGILSFQDGKLEVPNQPVTYQIIESYGGSYTELTWNSDGILQVSGEYTLQVCTLDFNGDSRGFPNPTFLDFIGGKLVDIRE